MAGLRLLPPLLLVTFACVPHGLEGAAEGARRPTATLQVDASAAPGGDGSVHRPLATLEEALGRAGAGTVRLAPGRYVGPFRVAAGVVLEGPSTAVLTAGPQGPLLVAEGALLVRGLTLEGGTVAVAASGPLTLEEVVLTGQEEACIRMEGGGLRVRGGRMETQAGLPRCIVLAQGVRAQLARVRFSGRFERAVEVLAGATLQGEKLRFDGAFTAVHARAAEVRLTDVEVAGGSGPALFAAGGSVVLDGLRVQGHEYGLQTGAGTRLTARRFESREAARAGLALVQTRALLEGVRVRGSGPFGGVQLLGGDVTLRDVRVEEARALGISVLQGRVTLERGEVRGVRGRADEGDGDGVSLRRATVTLRGLAVTDVAGIGVLAAEGAEVSAEGLTIERAGVAGVAAESGGRLAVSGTLAVRGAKGPALLVVDTGDVRARTLVSEANVQGALMAECEAGAHVEVGEVRGDALAGLERPCVSRARKAEAAPPP